MKTEVLIKEVRSSTKMLWDSHQRYIATNGEQGMCCFTPDILEQKYRRTDEDIIREAEEKGIHLEDKDEYLAKLKEIKGD